MSRRWVYRLLMILNTRTREDYFSKRSFWVSVGLLIFCFGAFVGKQFSDGQNQVRLAQLSNCGSHSGQNAAYEPYTLPEKKVAVDPLQDLKVFESTRQESQQDESQGELVEIRQPATQPEVTPQVPKKKSKKTRKLNRIKLPQKVPEKPAPAEVTPSPTPMVEVAPSTPQIDVVTIPPEEPKQPELKQPELEQTLATTVVEPPKADAQNAAPVEVTPSPTPMVEVAPSTPQADVVTIPPEEPKQPELKQPELKKPELKKPEPEEVQRPKRKVASISPGVLHVESTQYVGIDHSPLGKYTIQVLSTDLIGAQSAIKRYASMEIKAFYIKTKFFERSQPYYRVCIGEFDKKSEAQVYLNDIIKKTRFKMQPLIRKITK